MGVTTKTLILQFLSFALLFIIVRTGFVYFTELRGGLWLPLVSAVIATILAPQFKVFKTNEGDKICMRWIFIKGVKVLN